MGKALILFDIDGTLMRRSGPHHGQALEDAVRLITGVPVSMDRIPTAGMLDRDILNQMMTEAGLPKTRIRSFMPAVVEKAQLLYARRCPDLTRRICPGVRRLLPKLVQAGAVTGLVTGNLSRIGWKKVERAGLREYFRYGSFAEMGRTRGELAKLARRRALREGWVDRRATVLLVGDHPNDVAAARESGCISVAVATGVIERDELAKHRPDVLIDDLRKFPWEAIG
jgi:phosphoglycolate phosphatase